jgi:hypothetical protein
MRTTEISTKPSPCECRWYKSTIRALVFMNYLRRDIMWAVYEQNYRLPNKFGTKVKILEYKFYRDLTTDVFRTATNCLWPRLQARCVRLAHEVTLLTCIRKALSSNIDWEIDCFFRGIPQSLQVNAGILKLGHDCCFLHRLKLIIDLLYIVRCCIL